MKSENLVDRITSCFIGLGVGVGTRIISQDHDSARYFAGAVVAGASGILIPSFKNKEKNEKYIGIGSSLGMFPAGYYLADYILRMFH